MAAGIRSRLIGLAFSIVLFVVLLGLAELGARWIYRDALQPHPPVARNRLRYRDRNFGQKKPNRYRIIVIGDSFTFGDGIEEGDRFSNLMQAQLGAGFEVLNFGRAGFNMPQHLRTLDQALQYKPDYVLLQLYENDFETPNMHRPAAHTLQVDTERQMQRSFVLYRLISTASVRVQEALGLSEEYTHYMASHLKDPASPDAREAFGMLTTFITKAQAAHVAVGTVLFPALWVLKPGGRDYPFDYLHAHVRTICQEQGITCLDLFDEFAQDENPRHLWVNSFDAHPNAEANHRAAQQILKTFRPVWSH
jgi:lysophospholipase L1-like esterase